MCIFGFSCLFFAHFYPCIQSGSKQTHLLRPNEHIRCVYDNSDVHHKGHSLLFFFVTGLSRGALIALDTKHTRQHPLVTAPSNIVVTSCLSSQKGQTSVC